MDSDKCSVVSFRPLQINKALKLVTCDLIYNRSFRPLQINKALKRAVLILDIDSRFRPLQINKALKHWCHKYYLIRVLDHYKLTRLSNLKSDYFSGLRFSPSLTPWQGAVNYASIIQQSLSYIKHFSFFSFPEKLPSINNKNTFS